MWQFGADGQINCSFLWCHSWDTSHCQKRICRPSRGSNPLVLLYFLKCFRNMNLESTNSNDVWTRWMEMWLCFVHRCWSVLQAVKWTRSTTIRPLRSQWLPWTATLSPANRSSVHVALVAFNFHKYFKLIYGRELRRAIDVSFCSGLRFFASSAVTVPRQFARLLVLVTAAFAAAATKRVWNELPSSVVNVSSLAEFKKRLQTEPLEQYLRH